MQINQSLSQNNQDYNKITRGVFGGKFWFRKWI